MRKNRKIYGKGFTLVELLVVVAIVVILLAVAVPSVISYSRELKLTELDDCAHSIYMAAQSNLSAMINSGKPLAELGGDEIDGLPKSLVSLGSENKNLSSVVPFGSVSPDVRDSHYVVEFDEETGAVYAVWYWEEEKEFSYETQAYTDATSSRAQRLKNRIMVGYYGGSRVDRPQIKQTPLPKTEIINAEELLLKISVPDDGIEGKTVLISVTLVGESGSESLFTNVPLPAGKTATVALDTLDKEKYDGLYEGGAKSFGENGIGKQFKDWVGGTIAPGENFDIEIEACVDDEDYLPQSVYRYRVNGLFADLRDGAVAEIAYGRHLQNLDQTTSGVDPAIVRAVQTKDIAFADNTAVNGVFSWKDTYGKRKFVPIDTTSSIDPYSYDGQGRLIRDPNIAAADAKNQKLTYVGLFAERKKSVDLSLKNMTVVDPVIEEATVAGVLTGYTELIAVENCRVYLDHPEDAAGLRAMTCAGGLIGITDSAKIKNSFASVLISVPEKSAYACHIGGLIGEIAANGSASIERSYAAGHLSGNIASDAIGGLVGEIAANGLLTLRNCYAAGVISGAKTAGGLAAMGTPAEVSDCYTAVRYAANMIGGTSTVYGTFPDDRNADAEKRTPFVSQLGLNYQENIGRPETSFELYLTGGYLAKESEKSAVHPYFRLPETENANGLSDDYPYRMIATVGGVLPHYGDWLEECEAYLVYYEQYNDGTDGVYSRNARFEVNTLKAGSKDAKLDDRVYAVDDGYAFFVLSPLGYDRISLPASATVNKTAVDKTSITLTKKRLTVAYKNTTVDCAAYALDPASYLIGADWTSHSTSTNLLQQPLEQYYTTIEYTIDYPGNFGVSYENGYNTRTYYFNPHFACETLESEPKMVENAKYYRADRKPGADGGTGETSYEIEGKQYVVIRTARQLSNLHGYTNHDNTEGIAGVKEGNLQQFMDIDYALYRGAVSGGNGENNRVRPALLYRASYSGNNHVIRNIYLSRISVSDKNAIGLFGKIFESTIRDLQIVNANALTSLNGWSVSYMGGLVGHMTNSVIEKCGIYVESKELPESERSFVSQRPYYRNFAINSNDKVVIGGLIGGIEGSSSVVSECFASVKVYGKNISGGLIGEITAGTVKDCYTGGYVCYADIYGAKGNIDGFPCYSELNGSDSVSVSGVGFTGGFVGSVANGVVFEGVCYSSCTVRNNSDASTPPGLFAGNTANGTLTANGAVLYSTGITVRDDSTSSPGSYGIYEYYKKITPRNESYLLTGENVPAGSTASASPYCADLGTVYPYQSNLSVHHGDWSNMTAGATAASEHALPAISASLRETDFAKIILPDFKKRQTKKPI